MVTKCLWVRVVALSAVVVTAVTLSAVTPSVVAPSALGPAGPVTPVSAPKGSSLTALPTGLQRAGGNVSSGTATSENWAGYGVSGATFTAVQGSWTQPRATCPTSTKQLASFWVGIDGLSGADPTIEQVGTDSDCVAGGGDYYAWYEMDPKGVNYLSSSKYPVVAGETIGAAVSASGKVFTLSIEALSGGVVKWRFSTNQTTSTLPQESSAEWIAETPCRGSSCVIGQLADFGAVAFTHVSADGLAVSSYKAKTELTMTNKKTTIIKARPSALTSGGTAFTVTWDHT